MDDVARRLVDDVAHLTKHIGTRPPGSAGEAAAAEWIAQRLGETGLDVRLEPFSGPSHIATGARLTLVDDPGVEYEVLPSLFSVGGDVSGPLCILRGDPRHWQADDLRGGIGVWLPAGNLGERTRTVRHLQESGLAGLALGSSGADIIETKMIRDPALTRMPVAAVSWRTARALACHAGAEASLGVNTDPGLRASSRNVVGVLPGTTDQWLVVSAHHDTAPFCEGATDNAGGVATLLEVARILRDAAPLQATVYLVSTAAEEYGRDDGVGAGAQAFIAARRDTWPHCLGWIEIDGVGNPLGSLSIAIGGPKPFRDTIMTCPLPAGAACTGKPAVGCDHGAAEQRGIPVAWFTDGSGTPRPYYHTPSDRFDLFDPDRAASYVPSVAGAVTALSATRSVNPVSVGRGWMTRQARHEDIDAAVAITRAAFGPFSGDRMAEEFFGEPLGGRPWHAYKGANIERAMRSNIYRFIVTEWNGRVVGFASFLTDEQRGIASIGNNAVHPECQGQGIGTAQQREIDRRMKQEGFSRFKVVTLSNDVPAQAMYERLGYERISETINYLRGHDQRG